LLGPFWGARRPSFPDRFCLAVEKVAPPPPPLFPFRLYLKLKRGVRMALGSSRTPCHAGVPGPRTMRSPKTGARGGTDTDALFLAPSRLALLP